MTLQKNEEIAKSWLSAFNGYNVSALVALYAENATHTSPRIRALHPESDGRLTGHAALKRWWEEANRRLPGLRYELTSITANAERVFIEYLRHSPYEPAAPVAEVFDIRDGKIAASRVYPG